MAIKNIIFDFGGVLIDWNPRYFYKDVFSDIKEMEYFLSEVWSPDWNMKHDAGFSFSEITCELQKLHPEYRNEIEMYQYNWEVMIKGEISENTKLLDALKSKYRLFGLTNWSAEAFPVIYPKYEFFKVFEGIVVSGEEKVVKPGKEIYQLLLNKYSLLANESLFIDDSLKNIETANELGFSTIHINGIQNLKEQLISMGLI
ncbi:MAG TPA: HAD family phosphatase [Bacteroidales bacterium]|nr:HAD family phosphatase [Bacteroidales bacterium]